MSFGKGLELGRLITIGLLPLLVAACETKIVYVPVAPAFGALPFHDSDALPPQVMWGDEKGPQRVNETIQGGPGIRTYFVVTEEDQATILKYEEALRTRIRRYRATIATANELFRWMANNREQGAENIIKKVREAHKDKTIKEDRSYLGEQPDLPPERRNNGWPW